MHNPPKKRNTKRRALLPEAKLPNKRAKSTHHHDDGEKEWDNTESEGEEVVLEDNFLLGEEEHGQGREGERKEEQGVSKMSPLKYHRTILLRRSRRQCRNETNS